ncbi:hypothetical protein CHS0354_018353 [Potamilus streckersoni]|uniref:(Dimethylallyl)adenosine tRNA methylthiotransferase MiaB n=1 Tax=Potamilus streckersoni TaxID=2493646 RepID=A0AAE0TAG1_9BIVA|nr:hypothetical protein CHS0354_018353 [Potamilus streckersoni]
MTGAGTPVRLQPRSGIIISTCAKINEKIFTGSLFFDETEYCMDYFAPPGKWYPDNDFGFSLKLTTGLPTSTVYFTFSGGTTSEILSDCDFGNFRSDLETREKLYFLAFSGRHMMQETGRRSGEYADALTEILGCTQERDKFFESAAGHHTDIFREEEYGLSYAVRLNRLLDAQNLCRETPPILPSPPPMPPSPPSPVSHAVRINRMRMRLTENVSRSCRLYRRAHLSFVIMKRAYIQTFGCQMNEHDSQRMAELLTRTGYELSAEPADCDVIILNTCSVREAPENKVYSQLGRIREYKKQRPGVIIGVGGCVAQQEGENILKREKYVDIVFGTDQYMRLPDMIAQAQTGQRVLSTDWMPRLKKIQNFIPEEDLEAGHVEKCKSFISITKGCDNFCSFCIVPFTRGREVSREPDNILREARSLIDRGAKEIMLLGQNVNSYSAGDYDFYRLLRDTSELDGLYRLRFTSPHPKDWNDRLSDLMAESPVICSQLHLPFQSGSSRIVDLMRRGHTTEVYLKKINYLKSVCPDVGLSTDIIVGFPTETESDFQETLDVLKEVRYSQIYAFKYSPRPGTRAAKMEDDVPTEVKEDRLARLLALQKDVQSELFTSFVGRTFDILVDGAHPKIRGSMNGRTDSSLPVVVPDCGADIGDIISVEITGKGGNSLFGQQIVNN